MNTKWEKLKLRSWHIKQKFENKLNTDKNECVFRGDVWKYQCKERKNRWTVERFCTCRMHIRLHNPCESVFVCEFVSPVRLSWGGWGPRIPPHCVIGWIAAKRFQVNCENSFSFESLEWQCNLDRSKTKHIFQLAPKKNRKLSCGGWIEMDAGKKISCYYIIHYACISVIETDQLILGYQNKSTKLEIHATIFILWPIKQ